LLLCCIVLRTIRGGRTAARLGLAGPRLRHGWWIVPAAGAFAALLLLGAHGLGTLHDLRQEHRTLLSASLYTTWSFVQEFMAQSFILVRLEELLERRWAPVMATALIFSVAHIPNVPLVLLTLFGGALFSALFQRYRNLYALGAAHSILGLAFAISMPDWMLHHMKVGLAYFAT
jgi:membrane protease YdiL (CAAX protease family)